MGLAKAAAVKAVRTTMTDLKNCMIEAIAMKKRRQARRGLEDREARHLDEAQRCRLFLLALLLENLTPVAISLYILLP